MPPPSKRRGNLKNFKMQITLKYFGGLQQPDKVVEIQNKEELEIPNNCLLAVNMEYCLFEDMQLKDGDEVAIIPPVSGG